MEKYCKQGQPAMNAGKAAEIYFNKPDILDKGIYMMNRINGDRYAFSHVDDFKNGVLDATARPCIFYDAENDRCGLGDMKPDVCGKGSDTTMSLTKDIINLGFDKKGLKKRMARMKEDMILYLTVWHMNRLLNDDDPIDNLNDVYSVKYIYKLVMVNGSTLSAIRIPQLKAIDKGYESSARIYNVIQKNMAVLPPDYLELVVNKLNKFIKGGNFTNCELDMCDVKKSSVYLLSMFRLYVNDYKIKSKEFTGIVKSAETFNFLKDINEELGGNESGGIFKRERISCVLDNNIQMFKIIMKNK